MPQEKKLTAPITLFAAIEQEQHETLRRIAFSQHRSMADLVREAISLYIQKQPKASAPREKKLRDAGSSRQVAK